MGTKTAVSLDTMWDDTVPERPWKPRSQVHYAKMLNEGRGSQMWLSEVCGTIGGSSAAAACGQSRFTTRQDLWTRLTQTRAGIAPTPLPTQGDLRRGELFEPVALACLGEAGTPLMRHPQTTFMRHTAFPFAHVLPDAWELDVKPPDADGEPRNTVVGLIEVKVPRPGTIAKMLREGVPAEWIIQGQHGMAITGYRRCTLAVLDPVTTELHRFVIHADDRIQSDILSHEHDLWNDVLAGRPPGAPRKIEGFAEQTVESVKDEIINAKDLGEAVVLRDAETAGIVRRILELDDVGAEIEAALAAEKAALKARLGDTDFAIVTDVGHYSESRGKNFAAAKVYYSPTKGRKTFNHTLAITDYPALAEDRYWKFGEPSRPLRLYPSHVQD